MSAQRFAGIVVSVALVGLVVGAGLEQGLRGRAAEAADEGPAAVHYQIEAQSYLLVSHDGKTRAFLEVVGGAPRFALLDETGTERIVFDTDAVGSPSLRVCYPGGAPAVEVTQPAREIRLLPDADIRVHIGERPPDRPQVDPRSPLARLLAKINVRDPKGELKWTTDQFLKP